MWILILPGPLSKPTGTGLSEAENNVIKFFTSSFLSSKLLTVGD